MLAQYTAAAGITLLLTCQFLEERSERLPGSLAEGPAGLPQGWCSAPSSNSETKAVNSLWMTSFCISACKAILLGRSDHETQSVQSQ